MSKMSKAVAVLGVVAGLGVAAMPLSTYALTAQSADTTIKATVKDTIALVVEANENDADAFDDTTNTLNLGELMINGPVVSKSLNAVVYANSDLGYTLSIAPKDAANTAMVDSDASNTSTIPALTANGALGGGVKGWGFRVADDAANTWRSIEVSTGNNLVLSQTGASTSTELTADKELGITGTGEDADNAFKVDAASNNKVNFNHSGSTTITFGAAADETVKTGTYSTQVVFTATTN